MTTSSPRPPTGLAPGGRQLWRDVVKDHELNRVQLVQLHEACRMKDRCDKLDALLCGDIDDWATLVPTDLEGTEYRLQIAGALGRANETANSMKQLLAAMRLPDEVTGKRPQQRGPRGAQKPSQPGGADKPGKVSSMDRARARAEARQTGA